MLWFAKVEVKLVFGCDVKCGHLERFVYGVSKWESLEAIFFLYKKWLEWCFTWSVSVPRLIFF